MSGAPKIHVSYSGWRFRVSRDATIPSQTLEVNPVTSLLVAGIATSEVFRQRFANELPWQPSPGCDGELRPTGATEGPFPEELDFEDKRISWIGCGSIAFAAVHALQGISRISGSFHTVDPAALNRSNVRKYIGLSGGQRGLKKAEILARLLRRRGAHVRSYQSSVNEYGAKVDFELPLAICSMDSSIARRDLQAKLPKVVLNAWTGGSEDSLFSGCGRYTFDGVGECLNCAYWMDVEGVPNLVDLAMARGTDSRSLFRRRREGLEFSNAPRGAPQAQARFLDGYFNACENLPIRPGTIRRDFSIPFIAAIGGALLASSVVAEGSTGDPAFRLDHVRLRYIMSPSGSALYTEPAAARSGCICQEPDYRAAFEEKWRA